MFLCVCRKISDTDVEPFIRLNPHMLREDWKVVSEEISGSEKGCQKACMDAGNGLLNQLRDEEEIAGLTASPCMMRVPA